MTNANPELVPGRCQAADHAILAAGGYTGWWDEHGQPAPWPHDFFDDDSDWHPAGSEDPTRSEPF